MPGELFAMSIQEVTRLEIIQRVESRILKQKEAAKQLGLSKRQVIRIVKEYRKSGVGGLISKHRGKGGNRAHNEVFKDKIMKLVGKHYADFGPTLAAEKLKELQKLSINKETLRQWMIEAELWKGKRRKKSYIHQQKPRRSNLGELVQIDGSPHDWFEGRAPECCLLVFIDDATSRLMELLFVERETTQGYFDATHNYLQHHGRPLGYYSDKHSIFRINIPEAKGGTGETQFARALRELGIELLCANTPQAKGRVERANKTLQDRLVKELRLRKINDIETANAYLPEFMEGYNKRFAVAPANSENSHRSTLPSEEILDLIFSHQHERRLSKNLELSYNNVIYQVKSKGQGYTMRHAKIKVCENKQNEVKLIYKDKMLDYKTIDKKNQREKIVSAKEVNQELDKRYRKSSSHKPKADHPWRQYKKVAARKQRKLA